MRKQRSMNLFLLLQAVFFTASAHAYYYLYDVIVAEVNGVFHPLSVAGETNTDPPIDSNQLVWGNPLAAPAFFLYIEDKKLINYSPEGAKYVKLSESGLAISNDEKVKTKFEFDSDQILINHVWLSCPNGKYHTLQTKENVNTAKLVKCQETKLHLLPFDLETRNIALHEKHKLVFKTKTSLSVPAEPPMALFANINNTVLF